MLGVVYKKYFVLKETSKSYVSWNYFYEIEFGKTFHPSWMCMGMKVVRNLFNY